MNKKNQMVTERKLKLDGHAHVFTTSLPLMGGRRYSPEKDALPEEYFARLKDSELDGALLVQPSFLGTDNSYMLQVMEQAQQTVDGPVLYGVAMLDPNAPYEQMCSLKERGIIGVRLNLVERDIPDFSDEEWKVFMNSFEKLNWHLEVHIEGDRQIEFVDKVPFAGNLMIDHFGLPASNDQLKSNLDDLISKNKFSSIYTKISGAYRVFPQDSFEESAANCHKYAETLKEALGSDNLIWGSDWPWTRHEKGQSYTDCAKWGELWLGAEYATMPAELL